MKQTVRLMFPKLTLFLLLLGLVYTCEEGCIKCASNSNGEFFCELCDLYSFFYKNEEGKCVQRQIENCLVPSADQNQYLCAQCKQGMILDTAALKCITVPEDKKIQNCRQYSLVGTCSQCYQHYYLKEGKCSRAKVIIENCRVYFNDDLCLQCDDDYQFDIKSGECKKFEPKENCGTHAFGKCTQCVNRYFLNPNPNLNVDVTVDSTQDFARNLWEGSNFTEFPISPCLKIMDSNCKTIATSINSGRSVQTCGTCKVDYYLNSDFKCLENPHWQVKNCTTYHNLNTCSKCADDYYLHLNECLKRTSVENCEIPDTNYDKCYKCVENYYNDNGLCKERTHKEIENCQTLSRIGDECETCKTDFKLTEDWIACFPEIKNCKIYDYGTMKSSGKFTCDTCEDNHFLINDFTFCKKQEVPHCDSYVTDTNICQGCDLGFYLQTGGNPSCEPITLTTCKQQKKDFNECQSCNNLFYLDSVKNCVPVPDVNCLENDTDSINCKKCKGNFYIKMNSSNTAKVCLESTTAEKVDFCEYSTSQDENIICSMCPYNVNPISLTYIVKEKPEFCNSVNTMDKCTQCKENTDVTYNGDSTYNCVPTINPDSICLKIASEKTAVLGDNRGICTKCRNSTTHFLNGSSCWERSPAIVNNCRDKGESKDECLVCNEGYHAKQITTTTDLKCAAKPVDFTPQTNCLVHNSIDSKKCVTCARGYILNSKFECTMDGLFINEIYSSFNSADGSFTNNQSGNDTMNGKCEIFDKNNKCRKCAKGYINVVKQYNNSNNSIDFSLAYSYPEMETCVKHTELVKKKINNDFVGYVNENECAEAILITAGSKDNYTCVRCANGANVNFIKAQYSPDNLVDISSHSIPTVENCNATGKDILSRKFSNVFFRRGMTGDKSTYWSSWVYYDTCPNSSENLIAIVDSTSTDMNKRVIPGDGITAEPAYKCHNFLSSGVENCWLYAAEVSNQSGFDYSSTAKCIACRPGYFATIKANTNEMFIETCTAIPDCDVSNIEKNTYLNACETCATDKYHPWVTHSPSNQGYIDISTCGDRTKTNCLNETSGNKCHHCALGFQLDSTKQSCEPAPAVNECKTFSYRKESIDFSNTVSYPVLFNLTMSIFEKLYNDKAFVGECRTCNDGFARFNISSKNENLGCSTVVGEDAANLITNCKLYKGNASKRCEQCEPGYLLSDTGESCVDNRLNQYPNCLKTKQGAAECASCVSNAHFNPTSKVCTVLNNCKIVSYNGTKFSCTLCNDEYMIDSRDNSLCVPTSIPNCLVTTNASGSSPNSTRRCASCKEGYRLFKNQSTNNSTLCVKHPYSSSYFDFFGLEFNSSFGIESTLNIDDTRYISTNLNPKKYQRQMCYKQQMPLCKGYASNKLDCSTCNDLHYLHLDSKTCTPNSIENCKVQANQYECTTCHDSYFVNSLKKCSKHQVQNCKTYNSTEDKCDVCQDKFYRNPSQGTCHQRLELNCTTFETDEDACSKCTKDYYLHNKKCIAYTVSGCLEFEEESDECKTCPTRYWKNSANRCIYNSQENCKTYSTTANQCDECNVGDDNKTHVGHYIKDANGVCQKMEEIVGCIEYDLSGGDKGECEKCGDNYLKISDKCYPYPNGARYCEVFLNPVDCDKCICGYYKDPSSSECVRVSDPIENCHRYSESNKCSECKEGYLLDQEKNTCSLITENSCLTWESVDSCATCHSGHALYQGTTYRDDNVTLVKKCQNKILKCLNYNDVTFEPGKSPEYTCSKCINGYLPSTDQKSCEPTQSIPGCLIMESVSECNTCMANYVLSVDKKTCGTDIRTVGANCSIASMTEEISCKVCKEGYMINSEGNCEQCGGEGCSICSKNDTSKCSLCAGGYFMSNSQTCSKNANNPFELNKESVEGGDSINVVDQS